MVVPRGGLCGGLCRVTIVATNLDLDNELLQRAFEVSGERTKKAAVTRALEEFIRRHDQALAVEHFRSLDWDPDVDHKAERDR